MNRSFLRLGAFVWCVFMCARSNAQPETPVVNGDPVMQPNGSLRFLVQGEFRPSLNSARESAVQTAQERLREWLGKQYPAVRRVPSLDTIRREMLRHEGPVQQEQILNQKDSMYKVTMEVELKPKHIRELRERDRVVTGMWTLGGLLALLGIAIFLFQIDEWTKGYLTRWLIAAWIVSAILLFTTWWHVR